MFTKGFKIVAPKRFEIYVEELNNQLNNAVVRVDTTAICKADLRYYIGNRDKRVLGLKYPMNLIHEAVGSIVKDNSGEFQTGDKVVMIPNFIPVQHNQSECLICNDKSLGENYCPDAVFASSTSNGFSLNFLDWPKKNLIKLNTNTNISVAVFSELISVANAAIRRIDIRNNDVVAIWGDGVLGYILYSVLKQKHPLKIIVIGHNEDKLKKMEAATTFLSNDIKIDECNINIAFECVGGYASENAINEIINIVRPGGKIVLTGVAENNISVNTRKILEKGLSLYGVTRSARCDFEMAVELLDNDEFVKDISKLILEEIVINDIVDYYRVFEIEAQSKSLGKHIMKFKF